MKLKPSDCVCLCRVYWPDCTLPPNKKKTIFCTWVRFVWLKVWVGGVWGRGDGRCNFPSHDDIMRLLHEIATAIVTTSCNNGSHWRIFNSMLPQVSNAIFHTHGFSKYCIHFVDDIGHFSCSGWANGHRTGLESITWLFYHHFQDKFIWSDQNIICCVIILLLQLA